MDKFKLLTVVVSIIILAILTFALNTVSDKFDNIYMKYKRFLALTPTSSSNAFDGNKEKTFNCLKKYNVCYEKIVENPSGKALDFPIIKISDIQDILVIQEKKNNIGLSHRSRRHYGRQHQDYYKVIILGKEDYSTPYELNQSASKEEAQKITNEFKNYLSNKNQDAYICKINRPFHRTYYD